MNACPYVRLNSVYLRNLQNSTEIHVILYIFPRSSIIKMNKVCIYTYNKPYFSNMLSFKLRYALGKILFFQSYIDLGFDDIFQMN